MTSKKCTSCKREISSLDDSVIFPCPKCGSTKIVRCGHCREVVAGYVCDECGFEGP